MPIRIRKVASDRVTRLSLHAHLGAALISCDDATLVFGKWKSEETPLLFREKSSLHKFAILGTLESVDRDIIRFRIERCGYIDIRLSPDIAFEYFDPATQRDMPINAIEAENLPEPPATGAGLIATTLAGEIFTFLEILLA